MSSETKTFLNENKDLNIKQENEQNQILLIS